MTTSLPRVDVAPADDGWVGACWSCGWRLWHKRRPVVDYEAGEHRASHARPRKGDG